MQMLGTTKATVRQFDSRQNFDRKILSKYRKINDNMTKKVSAWKIYCHHGKIILLKFSEVTERKSHSNFVHFRSEVQEIPISNERSERV